MIKSIYALTSSLLMLTGVLFFSCANKALEPTSQEAEKPSKSAIIVIDTSLKSNNWLIEWKEGGELKAQLNTTEEKYESILKYEFITTDMLKFGFYNMIIGENDSIYRSRCYLVNDSTLLFNLPNQMLRLDYFIVGVRNDSINFKQLEVNEDDMPGLIIDNQLFIVREAEYWNDTMDVRHIYRYSFEAKESNVLVPTVEERRLFNVQGSNEDFYSYSDSSILDFVRKIR